MQSDSRALTALQVWNREDSSLDPSYPADYYTARLYPFWVFISQTPFPGDASQAGLSANISHAKEKKRFYKHGRHSKFELPFGTIGRYVRVQLESFTYLHVAQIEVFGAPGTRPRVGRVTHVECGKQITAVTMGAVADPAYVAAMRCDCVSVYLCVCELALSRPFTSFVRQRCRASVPKGRQGRR